jgi:hypothetical protein
MGEMKTYEENDAVKYILSNLPSDVAEKYSDDDILLVIDIIFEFYENKGYFDLNDIDESDDEFDESELFEFVKKSLKKDKDNPIDLDDVENVVHLELEYEDSIDDFDF